MRYFVITALLAGFSLLFSSCDQDIDINDDWQDVGVVYGLLNPNSNTNHVRIERGYLGTEPASASFNQPDSLYYDTLQVYLYGINDNGDTIDRRLLVKDQSINLDSGQFTTEDYRLYRTDPSQKDNPDDQDKLYEDLTYHLRVIKVGTNFEDTRAKTELVEPNKGTTSGFRFQEPFPFITRRPIYNGRIAWFASDRAEMYEIDIYFHYRELDTTTNVSVEKSFKIDYETQTGPFTVTASPLESNRGRQELYEAIAANVEVNENVLRFYDKMRIVIWAGGKELRRYVQLAEPTTSLSQSRPEFMQVENGVGLLSSRTRIGVDNVDLAGGTGGVKNTFYLDPILCDRNFVSLEVTDTCYCDFFAGEPVKRCF